MAIFRPEDFGAKGDGRTYDTVPIQETIDRAHRQGGGIVVLEGGRTYLCGTIRLRSHVELHIAMGAVLLASPDLDAYLALGAVDDDTNRRTGTPVTRKPAYVFVYAMDCEHVAITGLGRIDGNGGSFVSRVDRYYVTGTFYPRPTLVYFEHCSHITFSQITLCNVSFWSLHTGGCDDVLIDRIRILNPLDVANSDGIDPDHSTNVRILGCHIVCADDCICLKNTMGNHEYPGTRSVLISGCTLVSTSAALKIGTEGVDDFENILVEHCVISGSNRGISIQIRDQGNVRNVSFRDIIIETRRFSDHWWGSGEPIAITSYDRDESVGASGTISGVRFKDISCRGENGILVSCMPGRICDLLFEDVSVELVRTTKWPVGTYDLRPGIGHGGIVSAPNAAVRLDGAAKVELRNVRARIEPEQGFGPPLSVGEGVSVTGCVEDWR